MIFQSLFLQCSCTLARTLASACIGTRTLTTHWQTATMAEPTVAADVHQSLDVHGGLAAEVAFDRERADLIANFFKFCVAEVLDFLVSQVHSLAVAHGVDRFGVGVGVGVWTLNR